MVVRSWQAEPPSPCQARAPRPWQPALTPTPRPTAQAGITIASFDALRGCAATRDVRPGEKVLSIPESVLIYEDTVRQTDLVGQLGSCCMQAASLLLARGLQSQRVNWL